MIINSLLDTDLYKFTMMQLVFHRFPNVEVEYRFTNRTKGIGLSPLASSIQAEIDHLCNLTLSPKELNYLSQFSFFQHDFIEYLKSFRLNKHHIKIETSPQFDIVIKGPWLSTILFEVPMLAIVSELYYHQLYPNPPFEVGRKQLLEKIKLVLTRTPPKEFKFIEFGTRRRFSLVWHQELLHQLKLQLPFNLIGTSNVLLAKNLNLIPMGTMAHEYIQAFQSLAPDLRSSQISAFKTWLEEYKNELGIALSDTYTQAVFLNDFTVDLANAYQGIRQDSGDPFDWGEQLIKHYRAMGIDPKTKTLVFSNALTFDSSIELFNRFHDRINVVFGIGTNLTNDLGPEPIQIVIKMTQCNGKSVAKLSDSPSKTMSHDMQYLELLKKTFQI